MKKTFGVGDSQLFAIDEDQAFLCQLVDDPEDGLVGSAYQGGQVLPAERETHMTFGRDAKLFAKLQQGLRVFLRDEAPIPSIAERLGARGDGEISLVVLLGPQDGEIEVKLPGRYAVTGALAGSLKSVAGVVQVEHV